MRARRAVLAALLTLLALVLAPGVALAHAELESSSPADGAVLAVAPAEITGDFSAAVDPARSSMELRGPDGAVLATGGVPGDGPATRMTIAGLPELAPGAYEVRWTTVTADDNGVERGTFAFAVAAATPSPSPSPSLSPTAATTGTSEAPTVAPPTPTATPVQTDPTASAPPPDAATGDLLLPLAVLGAILLGGGAWLALRRR
jgi:hypothetical protein